MKTSIPGALALSLSLATAACGGALDPSRGEEEGAFPTSASPRATGVTLDEDGSELAGVEVCIESSGEHCTTTAEDGSWTLSALPTRQQLWVTFTKPGLVPALRPVFITDEDSTPLDLEATVLSRASGGDGTARAEGAVSFETSWRGAPVVADAEVALIGMDDGASEVTYVREAGADGVFANIAPGSYLMTFQSAAAACGSPAPAQVDAGYLAGFPIALRAGRPLQVAVVVRVVAGYVTGPVIGGCGTLEVPAR